LSWDRRSATARWRRRKLGRYILARSHMMNPPDAMRARQREVLATLAAKPSWFMVAWGRRDDAV